MFSKSCVKLIIILFLGTIIPLIFDSYVFDVVEGNVALSKACATGTGAKGACASLATAAAQAKAAADLAKATKAGAPAAVKATKAGAPAAVSEETEEDKEITELFTVKNDRTNEFAYAYVTESFVEGAAVGKKPLCKIVSRLDKKTKTLDSSKSENTPTINYVKKLTDWYKKKC